MKKALIIVAIAAAAWYLLRPRKTETGETKKSIFADLFAGIYSGSMLSASDSPFVTADSLFVKPTLVTTSTTPTDRRSTSDTGRTDTPTTTSTTSTTPTNSTGTIPTAVFSSGNKITSKFK